MPTGERSKDGCLQGTTGKRSKDGCLQDTPGKRSKDGCLQDTTGERPKNSLFPSERVGTIGAIHNTGATSQ